MDSNVNGVNWTENNGKNMNYLNTEYICNRTMNKTDARASAIQSAKKMVRLPYYVLDTETTGLDSMAQVIEIAVIDSNGVVVINTLVKPIGQIPAETTQIHGITNEMVYFAPTFRDLWPRLSTSLEGQTLGIYGAEFDTRLIKQSCRLNTIERVALYKNVFCIMEMYAKYFGEWDEAFNDYKWQKLEEAVRQSGIAVQNTHRALEDALLAREVLLHMASNTRHRTNSLQGRTEILPQEEIGRHSKPKHRDPSEDFSGVGMLKWVRRKQQIRKLQRMKPDYIA